MTVDIRRSQIVQFLLISIVSSLLCAAFFRFMSAHHPCSWTYVGIGLVIGVCITPYLFAMFIMFNVEKTIRANKNNFVAQ